MFPQQTEMFVVAPVNGYCKIEKNKLDSSLPGSAQNEIENNDWKDKIKEVVGCTKFPGFANKNNMTNLKPEGFNSIDLGKVEVEHIFQTKIISN